MLTEKAVDFVDRRAPAAQPFFLWLTYTAPHPGGPDPNPNAPTDCTGTAKPAPRHAHAFDSEPLPRPPNFNEQFVTDKPAAIQAHGLLTSDQVTNIQRRYRCELESLLSVDEGVKKVVDALRANGELGNTLLVYTSDNGSFHGEHRLPNGKQRIYEESIRVPLQMRGPGIPAGENVRDLSINADLAPTIVDVANANPGLVMDGRSLMPVAQNPGIESGRELLIEEPTFEAIRTERYMYAEHSTGEKELYDLTNDPFELQSRHNDPAYGSVKAQLANHLHDLQVCAGPTCLQDSTAPNPPTLSDTDPDSPANDNSPKVKGSAEAGSTVSLFTSSACTGSPAAQGSAANLGSPGLTASVADDSSTTFRATATDASGNTSACSGPITYVEDSTAPNPPTLSDTDPDSPANDNSPKVKGSAEAGSTVSLFTSSACTGSPAAQGSAANLGSPGLTASVADDSSTTFRATATDASGNTSACSGPITYVEDSTAPNPPTLSDTDPDSPANDNSPKVKGSAEAGSTVSLFTSSACTGSPAAQGSAANLGSPGLTASVADDSSTAFRATATDASGNTSACSGPITYVEDSTAPNPPTLSDTDPDSPANDNSPKVKGSAEAGSTVSLFTSSACTGSPAAQGSAANLGSPGLTASVADDSSTTFRATATDASGNTSACSGPITYVEDSTAPNPPTLSDTDPDSPANDNSPKVKGSAEAGSTVSLFTSSACTGSPAAQGSAANLGSPGLTASVADDSSTAFRATATDASGNTSACSGPITYVEDSTAPNPPTLSDTDPDSPANDNSPKVKGSAEAGSTVSLFTSSACTGSPAAQGSAANLGSPGLTASVADDSSTTFRATATDASGNTSACSGPITYVEDSTAPNPPTLSDTDPDSPANDNSPKVKGSAEAGSTVSLFTSSACTGSPAAQGSAANLGSPGLTASVADDSSTAFRATATDAVRQHLRLLGPDHLRRGLDRAQPADALRHRPRLARQRQLAEGQGKRRGGLDREPLYELRLHRLARRPGLGGQPRLTRSHGLGRRRQLDGLQGDRDRRVRQHLRLLGPDHLRRGLDRAPTRRRSQTPTPTRPPTTTRRRSREAPRRARP